MKLRKIKVTITYTARENEGLLHFKVKKKIDKKHIWDPNKSFLERYEGASPIIGGNTAFPEKIGEEVYNLLSSRYMRRTREKASIPLPFLWMSRQIKNIVTFQIQKEINKFPPAKDENIAWGVYPRDTNPDGATIDVVAMWYQELPEWREWAKSVMDTVVPQLPPGNRAEAYRLIREGL